MYVSALPAAPVDVKISEVTATSAKVSWTHPTPTDILYYVLQYRARSSQQAFTEISGIITLYYTVRNLSPFTEYEFFVTAVNNLGRGPPSAAVPVTTVETGMLRILDLYFCSSNNNI